MTCTNPVIIINAKCGRGRMFLVLIIVASIHQQWEPGKVAFSDIIAKPHTHTHTHTTKQKKTDDQCYAFHI